MSARVTLAVLVAPGEDEAGDRRDHRRERVQDDQDLPRACAGEPRRDRVVADGVQEPAEAGPPQHHEDQRRDRQEDDKAVGQDRQLHPGSEGPQRCRHARSGLDHHELPHVGQAEHDQAHAQGHDQRVDAEHAHADAVEDAGQCRDQEGDEERDGQALAADEGRDHEPAHRGDGADGQVDPAGQERERLAGGEQGQRDGRPHDHAGPAGVDDLGLEHPGQGDQQPEQREQRDQWPIAEHAPPVVDGERRAARLGGAGDARLMPATAGAARGCRSSPRRSGSRPGRRRRGSC